MSVTRRTGLGAIVGAIFGGPAAADAAKESISDLMARSVMTKGSTKDQFIGDVPQASTYDPVEAEAKRIEHIRSLTKSARGELNEYEQEEIDRCNKMYTSKIPLKSVSKSYKNIMRKNEEVKRQKNEWINEAKRRLLRHYGINI